MIKLLKYTYLMKPEKVREELEESYRRYQEIIAKAQDTFLELNEARAILYLTGQIYCEKIAIEAIEHRLHRLENPLSLQQFLGLIDTEHEILIDLRKDPLFKKLEEFYRIIKDYKMRYEGGKYYLDEEKFVNLYNAFNPSEEKIGYKGKFDKESKEFMN